MGCHIPEVDAGGFLTPSANSHVGSIHTGARPCFLKQWALWALERLGLSNSVRLWLESGSADDSEPDLRVAPARSLERAWRTMVGVSPAFSGERDRRGIRIRRGILRHDVKVSGNVDGEGLAWNSSLSHCGPANTWGAALLTQELDGSAFGPRISVGIDTESTARWIHPGVRRLIMATDESDRSILESSQIPLAAVVSIKEAVFKADWFQGERTLASYALFEVRRFNDALWCGRAKAIDEADGVFWFAMQRQLDCCLSLALAINHSDLTPMTKTQDGRPRLSEIAIS